MRKLKFAYWVVLALSVLLSTGCGKRAARSDKLQVVTTIGMITDIAQRVAGDQADVTGLMGPGVDPHLYKASHGDMERLSQADIVFYNGLHLEGKMVDVLMKMARERPVVAVTEAIPEGQLSEPPEFAGQYDPHVWMDPRLWKHTLVPIVRELSRLRPAAAGDFQARADAIAEELDSLYAWAQLELAAIPAEQRVLVTAHDAFGYFGRAFQVKVRGLQGISTASEYGLNDVTELVNLLVQSKVKAVFVETSVPTKPLEAVIEGARARGHGVKIGGSLFSDAMGSPGTPEGTYVGMIRHNVSTIAGALR